MEAGPTRGDSTADSREHPPSVLGGDDRTIQFKRLSSSSSSSTSRSSSGDSFELEVKETSTSNAGILPGRREEDIPVSSMPKIESSEDGSSHDLRSDNGSAKQLPSVQVMERTGDATGSQSPYRIPSSVFSRTKSTAPMEWSVTSNESLFSIQMGNASFTRDQIYWIGKSQELGTSGAPPLPPATVDRANPTPANKSQEMGMRITNMGERQCAPAPAAQPQNDSKGSVDHGRENFPWPEVASFHSTSPSHHSDASGNSVKSFAFPILSRDVAVSGSLGVGPNGMKPVMSFVHAQSEPQTPRPPPKAAATAAASGTSQARWFSCFPCCSICSSG
ncbi:hypothetical protein BT93_B0334 [Corymbia citriodora subsp. variegata]|nr:hypothetical protein BT93_B0334 [Corymbia citriodora subsp. variegata]